MSHNVYYVYSGKQLDYVHYLVRIGMKIATDYYNKSKKLIGIKRTHKLFRSLIAASREPVFLTGHGVPV